MWSRSIAPRAAAGTAFIVRCAVDDKGELMLVLTVRWKENGDTVQPTEVEVQEDTLQGFVEADGALVL